MTDGNYENCLESKDTNYINGETCKRLLSAMQYGVLITHGDGHRWIYTFETDEFEESLNYSLRKLGKPVIRSKCYGNINDALDRIDGALKVLGYPSLLERFENDSSYEAWG